MIYTIDVTREGTLLTGKRYGFGFAEEYLPKSYLPTRIDIRYGSSQIITSSFFYGVLAWFEQTFGLYGLGRYSLEKLVNLLNVDDRNNDELQRAFDRL